MTPSRVAMLFSVAWPNKFLSSLVAANSTFKWSIFSLSLFLSWTKFVISAVVFLVNPRYFSFYSFKTSLRFSMFFSLAWMVSFILPISALKVSFKSLSSWFLTWASCALLLSTLSSSVLWSLSKVYFSFSLSKLILSTWPLKSTSLLYIFLFKSSISALFFSPSSFNFYSVCWSFSQTFL